MTLTERVRPAPDLAAGLAQWTAHTLSSAPSAFAAEQEIATRLGARPCGDGEDGEDGEAWTFGFWTPELLDNRVPDGDIFLEVLAPREPLDLTRAHQVLQFERLYLPAARFEAHTFAAAGGLRAGRRKQVGDFYALVWRDAQGNWHRILDPLAASLPFGAHAPAELYDVASMHEGRADAGYFQAFQAPSDAQPHKFGPPTNILQIHVPTATASGTLAALARLFTRLGERIEKGLPIEPADQLFIGYDAVQLLPVEPTIAYETGPAFWQEGDAGEQGVDVELTRPDTTNWGYDVLIAGSATVNPVLLESGRPDELVDLAVALHTFPRRPKMLILDVVFGHADNQGLQVLNSHFFAGPNMYGQNLDYRNPAVRAILLEMQRRKLDFGADGVRVDGAQDFKWWDPHEQELCHDDDYLQQMADIEQCVCGTRYRPWFIFEDGRPWPNEDWELASTYRAVIEGQRDDDVFQWGPLSFAHNTPFVYTFWLSKLWRIREILEHGANWISGTANHDTLRRGTQVSPKLNINTRLGETKMDILDKAYDNPVVALLTYAVLPGVPMDFLNATSRSSWGFVRNQDDRYGVKVVSEEAISLKWQVDEYSYSVPGNFRRLKSLGFETRDDLARFLDFLPALVEVTEYDLVEIAKLLNMAEPALVGPAQYDVVVLKQIARAWMDDMHEYCNVSHAFSTLDPAQTGFMLELRRFRRNNPWLRQNLRAQDHFDYVRPINGRTLFAALRHAPDGAQVFSVLHMEGGETEPFDPLCLPVPGLEGFGWELKLRTPAVDDDYSGGALRMEDSMGLLYVREAPH